jgi:hypothetical protein
MFSYVPLPHSNAVFVFKMLSKLSNSIHLSFHAHSPRSSRSCASMADASGNRGVISNSKGTGRLQKRPR